MLGWSPLWESIVESSIWLEPDHVLRLWVYFLARKDRDGFVPYKSPAVLANTNRLSIDKYNDALRRLLNPDPNSSTPNCDGRRIVEVEGGWVVVNHAKYRDKIREEYRREYQRKKQAEYRKAKSKHKKSKPAPGYQEWSNANNAGAPPEQLQAIEDKYAPAPGRFKNSTGDEIGMPPKPKSDGEVYSDDGRVIDQV